MSKQVVLEFPVDLPEESLKDKEALKKGKELIITIPDEPKKKKLSDVFGAAAGSWKDTIDCEKLLT